MSPRLNGKVQRMSGKNVSVWYDVGSDLIEVLWAFKEGYFAPTDDERIRKRLDDDGEVIGFLIHDMSTFEQGGPIEVELRPEDPDMADD